VCNIQCRRALCVKSQCRLALGLKRTVHICTLCVLHSVERRLLCTAQSREALCVLHTLERHCVGKKLFRYALYRTVPHSVERQYFLFHSVERHCLSFAHGREA